MADKKYSVCIGDKEIGFVKPQEITRRETVGYISGEIDASILDVIEVNGIRFVKEKAPPNSWDGDSPIRSFDKDS